MSSVPMHAVSEIAVAENDDETLGKLAASVPIFRLSGAHAPWICTVSAVRVPNPVPDIAVAPTPMLRVRPRSVLSEASDTTGAPAWLTTGRSPAARSVGFNKPFTVPDATSATPSPINR
jgi:hypothetical protein